MRRDIWPHSYQIFGWIEKSENTAIYLPLLIDKPSIKLTDTCVEHLLRMILICVQTFRVIGLKPLRWELHTFYLFWSDFLGENQEKPGGGLSPPGKNQNRNQFVFLSFGVDPLNWQSFIEIGEMACSTTAWCSHGYTIDGWHIFSFLKL